MEKGGSIKRRSHCVKELWRSEKRYWRKRVNGFHNCPFCNSCQIRSTCTPMFKHMWSVRCLLFSKDALIDQIWHITKTILINAILQRFYSSKNSSWKIILVCTNKLFSTLIITRNVSWVASYHIIMILSLSSKSRTTGKVMESLTIVVALESKRLRTTVLD